MKQVMETVDEGLALRSQMARNSEAKEGMPTIAIPEDNTNKGSTL